MRWWGWGREDRRVLLTPELAGLLDSALALDGHLRGPVAFGDVVLLAPGYKSFDQFRDFEDRGRTFAEAVAHLSAHPVSKG